MNKPENIGVLEGELLTVKEVIEMAQVSRNTLYRDIKSKKIRAIYFGRNVRFRRDDAEQYAESKRSSKWVNTWEKKKNSTQ